MIKSVEMYTVVCDNCGADSNEGTEYSCWSDTEIAVDSAIDSDWHVDEDKHYCPNCFSIGEDDEFFLTKKP